VLKYHQNEVRKFEYMSQTITLEIPDGLLSPLQRTAKVTKQPIEKLLLTALQTSLPSIDGLPDDFVENLILLENLEDVELGRVLKEKVSAKTQEKISGLLEKKKENPLPAAESKMLADLQNEADLTMLRKARAAVLLRFRGKNI